jgi:hypothetical protein
MFEKSLLRKKRLSFLFFEKIARKIILKNNWFKHLFIDKNYDFNKCLWSSQTARSVNDYKNGFLQCNDQADKKINQFIDEEIFGLKIFYEYVLPIKFELAKRKWDEENDPIIMAEIAEKKKKEEEIKWKKKKKIINKKKKMVYSF